MEAIEILDTLARGEDSRRQFKPSALEPDALCSEMVAFANSRGGRIIMGVTQSGEVVGLSAGDIHSLNQMISCVTNLKGCGGIWAETEDVAVGSRHVLVLTINKSRAEPFADNQGVIWVKCAADKRRVTYREAVYHLFEKVSMIKGDEIPAVGFSIADLDTDYFKTFLEKNFDDSSHDLNVALSALLENMNLMKDGVLNVSGAMLFAKNPSFRLPVFIVKAVSYPGIEIHEENYIDSQDITGKIADIFHKSMSFVLGNIKHIQRDQGVNAPGEPEIPRIVLEELIANALIHRDYFVSAPVRVFIFQDRVEIVSPGHLPNNLTIENIKRGNSNIRNPVLASYATKILPYRGLGSGIIRALRAYQDIEFEDDPEGNLFKAVIKRRQQSA